MDWLRHWILLELAGFIISFTIIWAGEFQWVELMTSFQVVAGLIILNIMVIGFYGIRQQAIFTSINTVPDTLNHTPKPKYKKSTLSKEEQQRLKDKLVQVMVNEKPFLHNKLDIDELAETVGTSKHNLSQTLNDAMDLNFYDFVNQYRVEEFKKRCTAPENDHLSLLGIALDCGFNSKSSFNHIFKKSEGITPSQFKLKAVAN